MKANKKTVVTAAAFLGVAALVAGGTIAYFTDNDTATNHFTVGNVDITLYESQLHRVNSNMSSSGRDGTASSVALASNFHICGGVANDYCTPNIAVQQGSMNGVSAWANGHVRAAHATGVTGAGQSGVFTDAQIIADANGTGQTGATNDYKYYDGIADGEESSTTSATEGTYVADEYSNIVPGKAIRKFAYVKNTGENNAYVRVKITVPASIKNYVDVHDPSTPQVTTTSGDGGKNVNGDTIDYAYFTKSESEDPTTGDKIITFVFADALKKDEMTYWSPINMIKLNENLKESDIANIAALREDGFGITVDAQAMQADGFASATAAFEAFDGQTGSDTEVNE